jgi:hypothetical protein
MRSEPVSLVFFFSLLLLSSCYQSDPSSISPTGKITPIDRQAVVERHNPVLNSVDPRSPFTLGNGGFAFTADITGLQSLPAHYFRHGIPLETKARWAWHTRANSGQYTLNDVAVRYQAYGKEVDFPTNMNSAAGQWLRQNPHDLPLARIGFIFDKQSLENRLPENIEQKLDLWNGILHSRYQLDGTAVAVDTVVDGQHDTLAANIESDLLSSARLAVSIQFPRGYDPAVKNTPDILWNADDEHSTKIVRSDNRFAVFHRKIDDAEHYVYLHWEGDAQLIKHREHNYRLVPGPAGKKLTFDVSFLKRDVDIQIKNFSEIAQSTAGSWHRYWRQGAAIDFAGSTHPKAYELERRIVLSRYLLASQARAAMPAQETGLTSSSWYGKHHTEMTWWHTAHWVLWGHPQELEKVLAWYLGKLDTAKVLAKQRGLAGARWAKMVGPDNRESPGGNSLIIWNQPQFIHLAELLYQYSKDPLILERYAELVDQTATAMAAMLVWDATRERYSLEPPIWIAQEIYDPTQARNPAFELAYWREGLRIAQLWRHRRGQTANPDWQQRLDRLAALPQKDNKYVAIESIPDTFDNIASRKDHPSMLAIYGLLNDPTVKTGIMQNTLNAVLASWDWQSGIWGWDYPMIAMTAGRLQQPQTAVDMLLADMVHNEYLPNGHCPQPGSALPVYLPANGSLLSAVAMMAAGWQGAPDRPAPGFPADDGWKIRIEGLMALP